MKKEWTSAFRLFTVFLISLFLLSSTAYSSNCAITSVGFTPLNDLIHGTYKGFGGGLYKKSNKRPTAHDSAGRALARSITPMDANGMPSANGRYALLSIGMSNTKMEFAGFLSLFGSDPDRDSHVVAINGAVGGRSADQIANPNSQYWTELDALVNQSGVSAKQVAAIWLKEADASPSLPFPSDAQQLQAELKVIVQILHQKFPNVKLLYFTTRIYAGYATTNLNPEPYAYQSGFAVKWLIQEQIGGAADLNYDPSKGTVQAPWMGWGPYLWADGMSARSDGLQWQCANFQADGTHPSVSGVQKVDGFLLNFFKTDTTAREWYLP